MKHVQAPTIDCIPAQEAIVAIDVFLTKREFILWAQSPEWVKTQIIQRSVNGLISQQNLFQVLDEAKSCKLVKSAAVGMKWIRQQWRRLRIAALET